MSASENGTSYESVLRPVRYFVCPNGMVLKTRMVSRLLLGDFQKKIQKKLEGSKPEIPFEVIDLPGPKQGEKEYFPEDPVYKAQLKEWQDDVNEAISEGTPDFLLSRGVLDVGVTTIDPKGASEEDIANSWQPWDHWRDEVALYRAENDDIELPDSDIVIFVGYLVFDTESDLQSLYNFLISAADIDELLNSFRSAPKVGRGSRKDRRPAKQGG